MHEMRSSIKIGLLLLPVSLGLFFGLFFGVAYPEVVRHGWSLSKCDILSARLDSRYCCERRCNSGCSSVPVGSPSCSSQISYMNSVFNPSACANDASACPSEQACDGGYYCCSNCCDTCQTCTNSCTSSPPTCSQSCSSHSCNCRCCSSTSRRYCTITCPSCYSVDLTVTFYSGRTLSTPHSATYHEDFGKDQGRAQSFYDNHPVNSTSTCYYNPKTMNEVDFDVSFTPWRWAVTSLFGFLPLLLNLGFFVVMLGALPAWRWLSTRRRGRAESQAPPPYQERDVKKEKLQEEDSEEIKST